ncbi:glutamate--tRNA ligase [Candidatus Schneideria nysicola]|uniref:glutamate--tRNA ligase n=1 Tax=Candidatus Schneideria nysicola TaxID=1081631 RepID=UPI001CAA701F|nr:glutamate--tRNA ligase [Candidatus Schneideria nysicola]UAJ65179.1 glutamate--tRNA ligase [Candidatus Schneideria nysicola]
MQQIRTRFSPSPTGLLHVGSIRTALFSWLFARKKEGKFLLRIEDTDFNRSKKIAVKNIIESMQWLNLNWDEGPYFQSQRFDRYNSIIDDMLNKNLAYRCYCSQERLNNIRKIQINNGNKPRYDGYCRNNKQYLHLNKEHVIRFCNPSKGSVSFTDKVRGYIQFDNLELDDFIIRRTDGTPTYNFCVVIDDIDMDITHVIRGEDHISNTPRQLNIFKCLNVKIPQYAHIPMILSDNGQRLSKRQNSDSILKYKDDGFLPDALLNHLVRLGWSYKNKEIFNREEMITLFDFSGINKSPSIFNTKKLVWLNHYYINHLPVHYIANHLTWQFHKENISIKNGPPVEELIPLFGKRYKTLKDIVQNCSYIYEDYLEYDLTIVNKYLQKSSIPILIFIRKDLENLLKWSIESIRSLIEVTSKQFKLEKNIINMMLRIVITSVNSSPPIDKILYIVGKKRVLSRIDKIILYLSENS